MDAARGATRAGDEVVNMNRYQPRDIEVDRDPADRASRNTLPTEDAPTGPSRRAFAQFSTLASQNWLPPDDEPLNDRAANHWPMVAIKGLLAIAIGAIGIAVPITALSTLVVAFALYCFADGIGSAVLANHHAGNGTRWAWPAVAAAVAFVTGAVAVIYPQMDIAALLRLTTAWSLLIGLTSVLAAARLENDHGRAWLVGSGVVLLFVAIVTGVALPVSSEMSLRSIAGGILVAGLLLGGLAIQLRAHRPQRAPARS
jgi:uncharacterized membrane protein HdeD (DUF308 family)